MNNEQIKRRLTFIMADASHLLQHLNAGKGMDEFTGFADNGHTHLSNIQIASNLEDTECDAWKNIHSMDAKTLKLITLNFSK